MERYQVLDLRLKVRVRLLLKFAMYSRLRGSGSSVGIATELRGWTVWNRIPVETRFSVRPDRHWAHTASCTMGTGSFLGVEAAGACC